MPTPDSDRGTVSLNDVSATYVISTRNLVDAVVDRTECQQNFIE